METLKKLCETWDAYTVTEKIDIYTKALMIHVKIFDDAKDANEACKDYDEAWETFKKAKKIAEETPEFKAWKEKEKAVEKAEEYGEYEDYMEADEAEEKAKVAYWKTSEFKTQDEAYSACCKARKKCEDEIDKVIKTMSTKFMGKELGGSL